MFYICDMQRAEKLSSSSSTQLKCSDSVLFCKIVLIVIIAGISLAISAPAKWNPFCQL